MDTGIFKGRPARSAMSAASFFAILIILLAAVPARAVVGICTISRLDVVGDFSFANIGAIGPSPRINATVTGGDLLLHSRSPFDAALRG